MNVLRRALASAPATVGGTIVAVGAISALAGCSTTAPAASGTSVTAVTPSASPSQAALLGTQLGKALLPASLMPSGFKIDSANERNSGSAAVSDSSQAVPSDKLCDTLGGVGWIAAGGIQDGAFAQNDYVNAGQTAEIGQEADTFTGADAATVMTTLTKAFATCASFTTSSGGTTAKVTLTPKKLSGVGDEAIEAVQTSPSYQGGTTIVAIRVGSTIVTTIDSSPNSDNGSAAVTYAEQIVKKLKSV